MTDDAWTNKNDEPTLVTKLQLSVTLKVDQLKYRNTDPISRYFEIPIPNRLEKIPTKIPNTDTDVKYRHRHNPQKHASLSHTRARVTMPYLVALGQLP